MSEVVKSLLEALARGDANVADTLRQLQDLSPERSQVTSDACVDLDRARRCGYPEVVYCEGKSAAAVVEIFTALTDAGQACLGTRASESQATAVRDKFPNVIHNPVARTLRIPADTNIETSGRVTVITAGTTDRPVAEEAVETLRWMNCDVEFIEDVGVAGPHRLPEQLHRVAGSAAVVVVAGMEGALPSVVGGYVNCPVVAVPTSVGYGAALGGMTALLGMLNSCASNVTVVNIDAGFKGGYVAGMIAKAASS